MYQVFLIQLLCESQINFLDKLMWKHLLTTHAKEKDTSVHVCSTLL